MNQPTPHRIGGRYEVGPLLGRGGMAEVRKGVDVRLGRTVAIKRLRTDLAEEATFQARFRREAQSSASLNHPAIVSIYDTGEEVDDNGVPQPYIVMEYVAGRTLRDILREGRKILPERALEITAGVLGALDYSHRAGIVHRDIKPANVMLTPSGDVKVMDFGIARAVSDASSTMTQTSAVVGTAQYLSPEQARGENVDSRSDVYSAGCLLYELLTGRPPFVGDSPVAVAYQHVREQPTPPSHLDSDLDPEVDAIVLKALAKPLRERYQSAAAMKADIERYLSGGEVQAAIPPAVAAAAASDATAFLPTDSPTTVQRTAHREDDDEEEQRKRWPLVLLALLLLALLTLAAIFLPRLLNGSVQQVSVPAVTGLSTNQAEHRLARHELQLGRVSNEYSDSVRRGLIISQDPPAQSSADVSSRVDVVVSKGIKKVAVPNVNNLPRDQAKSQLEDAKLHPVFRNDPNSTLPANTVSRTDPVAGTRVREGADVTVYISRGLPTIPDVRGLKRWRAESQLRAAGFQVKTYYDVTSSEPTGTVIDQSPSGGQQAPRGSDVTIYVAKQPPKPTQTPKPTPTPKPTQTPKPTPTPSPSSPAPSTSTSASPLLP